MVSQNIAGSAGGLGWGCPKRGEAALGEAGSALEVMSRELLLLHGSVRPRERAWMGPQGGPLNCGARCRNGHTPLRWVAKSEVCGGQAGPVVPMS